VSHFTGLLFTLWWPLSRQCEIPRQFHDISLMVCGTPAHVKCYSYHACTSVIVSGGGRNATVHDPKPKWNAQVQQSRMDADMQLTINSFRTLFSIPWLLVKSRTFLWQLSIPRYLQTSGHPVYRLIHQTLPCHKWQLILHIIATFISLTPSQFVNRKLCHQSRTADTS